MADIKFGFCMPAESSDPSWRATYVQQMNRALELVAGHFESVWVVDHLQFEDKDVLEGFTTLSYFAALHPQFEFGHSVLCQSFRNPALVAKMGATLDFLSGGRFILGLGTGWNEEEYRAFGYPFPSNQVRVEQLEEAVQIIKAMWTEPVVMFEGRHYSVREARCEPRPVEMPPIMIGAFKPKMLRMTARYADNWNVSSTGLVAYRRMAAEFERACDEVGRDPQSVVRSWGGGCICARTQEQAVALAGDRYSVGGDEEFDFVGTPGLIAEQMKAFVELGVSYFIVDCGGFPDLTTLELMVDEVLPLLNG